MNRNYRRVEFQQLRQTEKRKMNEECTEYYRDSNIGGDQYCYALCGIEKRKTHIRLSDFKSASGKVTVLQGSNDYFLGLLIIEAEDVVKDTLLTSHLQKGWCHFILRITLRLILKFY